MATDRRQRRDVIDRVAFVGRPTGRFPEVAGAIRPESRGLLHLEMADFRQVVEAATDAGRHWRVYQYLRFLDECVDAADDDLANAIDVSFVVDFARGDRPAERLRAVRQCRSDRLRRRVLAIDNRWR